MKMISKLAFVCGVVCGFSLPALADHMLLEVGRSVDLKTTNFDAEVQARNDIRTLAGKVCRSLGSVSYYEFGYIDDDFMAKERSNPVQKGTWLKYKAQIRCKQK